MARVFRIIGIGLVLVLLSQVLFSERFFSQSIFIQSSKISNLGLQFFLEILKSLICFSWLFCICVAAYVALGNLEIFKATTRDVMGEFRLKGKTEKLKTVLFFTFFVLIGGDFTSSILYRDISLLTISRDLLIFIHAIVHYGLFLINSEVVKNRANRRSLNLH
jgi:hypothetical protein